MPSTASLSDWYSANSTTVWWLSAISLVLLLVMPFAAAWAIALLPADYFTREKRRPLESLDRYPVLRVFVLCAKSLLGIVLLFAGLLMLVAPGQGVLTLLAGLILIEFPGKYRLERWLVTRPKVWQSMNWLRARFGSAKLKKPPQVS